MATLNILEYPDPRLRTKAQSVESVDDDIRRLIDDMFETMYASSAGNAKAGVPAKKARREDTERQLPGRSFR